MTLFGRKPTPSVETDRGELDAFAPGWSLPLHTCLNTILASEDGPKRRESDQAADAHALKAVAAAMNQGLNIRADAASTLKADQLPCIIILEEGGGLIAADCDDASILVLTADGVKRVARKGLDAHASRLAFLTGAVDERLEEASVQTSDERPPPEVSSPPHDQQGLMRRGFGRLLLWMVQRERSNIIQVLLAAVLSNMLMIALPLFIMTVYDRVIPHGAMETLWALALGVLIALALDAGLRLVRAKLTDGASLGAGVALQGRLFRALTHARLGQTPTATSDWTNTFRDAETATSLVPGIVAGVMVDLPFVFIILALIYGMAGHVVWAPIVGIALFALWAAASAATMRKLGAEDARSVNQRAELLTESAWLARTIKAANAQDHRIVDFDRIATHHVPISHRIRLLTGMQPQVTMLIVQAVIVASILIGVHQIVAGSMSIGALAATTILVGRVLTPVGTLMLMLARASQMSRPIDRVFDLLDLPQELAGDRKARRQPNKGQIDLVGINFTYPGAQSRSLNDVTLTVAPGERVAVIGRSGCGKSTLLQVLMRFYDADSGRYLVDGHDARHYAPQTLRAKTAYMPQDCDLLDGTVHDNIVLGNPAATRTELDAALQASGAADFIRTHPEGLSCRTGPRGTRLSGGERQAVALARTLITPASILILDEPTSAMDNTAEARVIDALRKACADRTLILSTHRMQALALVDRIIWMEAGRILADGPRDQVLAKLKSAA